MADEKPYPEVPVGNKTYTNAAVVIIGAGISGMCTAIDLIKRNNCRNFVILEKSAGFGGTWHDNKYPGCCCDVWSMLYSFSFAQNSDWTREYPGQEEILSYLVRVAQEYNLYQHVRFNTSVEESTWDDEAKKWRTKVSTAKDTKEGEFSQEYTISSDFLVSAVGQLNSPKWPEIEGIESFDGKTMHSARWDWSYDLEGKRVAMLGSGCTSAQIVPEIVKVAKHVTIFQRTPNWIFPRMDQPTSALMRSVYKYIPPIRWRKRAGQMDFREGFFDAVTDSQSDNANMVRTLHQQKLEAELPDRKDLWEKLTPTYNPGCKRVIISDDFFPALGLPNVDLETRPIDSISGKKVKVTQADGRIVDVEPEFDLLVCATGFKTTQFMHPIEMKGMNGRALSEVWKDGAQALYGTCVEDMPNFCQLYGPNTNLGHNSIILMIEAQSRWINGLIAPVLSARKQGKALSLRPKPAKVAAYNAQIQAELQTSSFNDPNCNSWYKNESGRITNNWSRTVVAYQHQMEEVRFDDFVVEGSGVGVVRDRPRIHVGRVKEETSVSDRTLVALGAVGAAAVVGSWLLRNSQYLRQVKLPALSS